MIRLFITSFLLCFFTSLSAQKHLILRADGTQFKSYGQMYSSEVLPINIKKNKKACLAGRQAIKQYFEDNNTLTDFNHILFYQFPIDGAANFGFFGQDWLVQWFEAPADMTINRAGFNVNAVDTSGLSVALKLVTVNWTKSQIESAGEKSWGYYQAEGNGFGNATAFLDNPDKTGDWVDLEGNGMEPPFGADLWSDSGNGVLSEPIPSGAVNVYQWTDMSVLGNFPTVARGSLVGVAVKNTSPTLDGDRIGMFATSGLSIPGFKFYANGRTSGDTATAGWWTRDYTWDFALDVTFPEPPPEIYDITILPTTLSTNDRTVNVKVHYNIVNVDLMYSVNSMSTWTSVQMTGTEPDYSGIIPGQLPGTHVEYYVIATDINGNTYSSSQFGYNIFKATSTNLLVFSGYSKPFGYPQSYYFSISYGSQITEISWNHDIWTFGTLTSELLNNYNNIIYITTNMKSTDANEQTVLRNWIDENQHHNLLIAGDEWLGAQTGWIDKTYLPGDFQYDILGIQSDHNDINYINEGDELLASEVQPIQGSWLGGSLYDKYNQVLADSDWTSPMMYNPYFEIGVNNWLDGVDFLSDVQVDLIGTAKDGVTNFSIAGHRTLPAGNKIAFFAYDPLSLDSDSPEYYWYGSTYESPQINVMFWWSVGTDVQQVGNAVPDKFILSQNYPNPFNPTTTIKYSIPANFGDSYLHQNDSRTITLKIYDVLGREIRTLVNEKQSAGNYQVQFDAAGLPSGVYVYKLQAGNFNQSKKMILLR